MLNTMVSEAFICYLYRWGKRRWVYQWIRRNGTRRYAWTASGSWPLAFVWCAVPYCCYHCSC